MLKLKNYLPVFLLFFMAFGFSIIQSYATVSNDSILYKTDQLQISRLTQHTFLHTSFLQTEDWGNVPCNGIIVVNNKEAIVFDSPVTPESAEELINYFSKAEIKIKAIIPTHFHEDCIGGLKTFHNHKIPSYAYYKTIDILKEKKIPAAIPENSFKEKLKVKIGNKEVVAIFLGEGHTEDNIIGYFPTDSVLFGGCLIKELGAGKGFLGDANLQEWPLTVQRVKKRFSKAKIIVPGHGKPGSVDLLNYTIKLFEE